MFPVVNEFNVVVGGIATFAATVGYACAKKLLVNPGNPIHCDIDLLQPTMMSPQRLESMPGPMKHETLKKEGNSTGLLRRFSLKRKRTDEEEDTNGDAGYPHNLSMIYPPKKRARTPTTEEKSQEEVKQEVKQPSPKTSRQSTPTPTEPERAEESKTEEFPEPEPEPATADKEQTQATVVATPPASPKPAPAALPIEPRTPSPTFGSPRLTTPSFPKTPFSGLPRQTTSSSSAFAAFAGSASPFAQAASSPFLSRNSTRSIWALGDASASTSALLNPNGDPSVLSDETKESDDSEDGKLKKSAIEAEEASAKSTVKETVKHVTGEEAEDVELELKNVKLFIKRGEKQFTTGMIGHMKLLSNKATLEERLLFRREPLWQVTMNVKVKPTVKCSFDDEESTLRIIAIEQVEDSKYEPVIYAMRPARSCTKQDFADFAKSLVDSPGFKTKAK